MNNDIYGYCPRCGQHTTYRTRCLTENPPDCESYREVVKTREDTRIARIWFIRLLAAWMVLCGVIAFMVPADAQEVVIPEKHWNTVALTYYVHTGCDDRMQSIIDEAAIEISAYSIPIRRAGTYSSYDHDARNTVGCDFNSPFQGEALQNQADGYYYEDETLTHFEDGKLFTLGTARTWFTDTGRLVEFDIWLNTLWMSTDSYAWHTTRHEWAHGLGIPHSEYGESLMAAFDGAVEWDIETIAKLALLYRRCEPKTDNKNNLWIPRLSVTDPDTGAPIEVYLVLPAGASWPAGVFWYGEPTCR